MSTDDTGMSRTYMIDGIEYTFTTWEIDPIDKLPSGSFKAWDRYCGVAQSGEWSQMSTNPSEWWFESIEGHEYQLKANNMMEAFEHFRLLCSLSEW